MKLESLVIVDQHATVKSYLGLVLPARHALEIEYLLRALHLKGKREVYLSIP
jgi:hypothetical protein